MLKAVIHTLCFVDHPVTVRLKVSVMYLSNLESTTVKLTCNFNCRDTRKKRRRKRQLCFSNANVCHFISDHSYLQYSTFHGVS